MVTSDGDFSWSLLNIWVILGAFEKAKWVLLEVQIWHFNYIWRGGCQGARKSTIPKCPPMSPQMSLREKKYLFETWTISLDLWWISFLEALLSPENNSPASKNMSYPASKRPKLKFNINFNMVQLQLQLQFWPSRSTPNGLKLFCLLSNTPQLS